jgi:YggT family protein
MMHPLLWLLDSVLGLYGLLVFIYLIIEMLISFNIINRYQPFVRAVQQTLARIIEPVLAKIRRFLPAAGPIDLSPIVLFLAIQFAQYCIRYSAL